MEMDLWTSFVDLLMGGLFALSQIYAGNMGLAIITLSLMVRLTLMPLSLKLAQRSMARQALLKRLQPELERLRARYRKDPERLARETKKLYQRYGVRPVEGLSILGGLIQAPILIGLFTAIKRGLGSGGPFLWIADISKPDLWLTLLVAALTYVANAINPNLPEQARTLMILLPTVLTLVFLWQLAAGLGLYWATSNIVTIFQVLILRLRSSKVGA
jgi:YidC/Oxa1 family membrane protein insertase